MGVDLGADSSTATAQLGEEAREPLRMDLIPATAGIVLWMLDGVDKIRLIERAGPVDDAFPPCLAARAELSERGGKDRGGQSEDWHSASLDCALAEVEKLSWLHSCGLHRELVGKLCSRFGEERHHMTVGRDLE